MSKRNSSPGISRIDQPEKRTHGFFVRLTRQAKTYSAFFTDRKHGGKKPAFAAAQKHYAKLLKKHGPRSGRNGSRRAAGKVISNMPGVRKVYRAGQGGHEEYWQATWSPRPHALARKSFAVSKYGARLARLLARVAHAEGHQKLAP